MRTQAETGGQQGEVHLAVLSVCGKRIGSDIGLAERGAAGGEEPGAASIGEEAVIADADEALREDVEQEATRELLRGERERSSTSAAVVLEAEGDGPVVDVEQPVVRDRDAVRVAGEVRQNVLGSFEGRLGVDDPLSATGVVEETLERGGTPVPRESAVQLDPAVSERFFELCHELAAEEAAQHAHRKEEAGSGRLPGCSVVGQAARREDAVHMWMVDERLAPGVQDREEPEAGAEVTGVQGDLLQRTGCAAQQEVVDDAGVLKRERREGLRQGEDHVRVGHGQHLDLACFEPARLRAALALRAVAVATRVVGDPAVPAGIALVDVTTQPCRAAREDPIDDGSLLPTPLAGGLLDELSLEASLEDLRDLVSRSLAHLLEDHQLRTQRVERTRRRA